MPTKKTGVPSDKPEKISSSSAKKKSVATAKRKTTPKAKTVATKAPAKKAANKKSTGGTTAATKKAVAKSSAENTTAKKTPRKKITSKPTAKKTSAKPSKTNALTQTTRAKPAIDHHKIAHAVSEAPQFNGIKPKSGHNEPYMNDEQLENFRQTLLAWRTELIGGLNRTVKHMKNEAAHFPDPTDRATQEEEFSLELRTRDRERKLVKKINETLDRISNQDYGYCDACGIEIGIKRLEARPTATLCIDCKTLAEIKEQQEHG